MICQNCGFENTPGDKFCSKCQNVLDFRALDSQMINISNLELVKEVPAQKAATDEVTSKNHSYKGLFILVIVLAIVLGVVVVVAKPFYDRHVKAEIISEAIVASRVKIERYVREHRSWPGTINDIRLAAPKRSKGQIDIKINNGTIEIIILDQPDKTLRFQPSINERGYIVWECQPGGISQDYLPAMCLGK